MSSDKVKAEQRDCLAVLAEVEQYILQGKRDPMKVAKRLQYVIDEPLGKLLFAKGHDADFLLDIQRKTMSGILKWTLLIRQSECGSDDLDAEIENLQICISKPKKGDCGSLRIYDGPGMPVHEIELSLLDKKFFEMVFENKRAEGIKKSGVTTFE